MKSLESYLQERHAPGTVKRYLREIDLFREALLLSSVENSTEANYNEIMNYLGKLRSRPGRSGVQNNISPSLHAIKRYYSYLVAIEEREDNPSKSIRLRDQRSRQIQLQDLFKPGELELLLDRKERYPLLKNRNRIILSLVDLSGVDQWRYHQPRTERYPSGSRNGLY